MRRHTVNVNLMRRHNKVALDAKLVAVDALTVYRPIPVVGSNSNFCKRLETIALQSSLYGVEQRKFKWRKMEQLW
jgi:hypothetical protein